MRWFAFVVSAWGVSDNLEMFGAGFWFQGYYRRASANMVLGKFKESLKDYETVSHINIINE